MRLKNQFLLALSVLLFWSTLGIAQSASEIDGLVYADYYYNFQNNISEEQDRNAFAFRRIYFTFENKISKDLKVRFRIESDHDKYGTTNKINPFVKHAYLEWSNLIPKHKLYFGIEETNAFKNAEHYWGYRAIEKTIMDLNKISSSADMGVAMKGDLSKTFHHWFTIFNGTGYGSSEGDRFKKIGYAFWITPSKGLILEGYADYEDQNPNESQTETILSSAKDFTGSTGYFTLKSFVGYKNQKFTFGAEAFWRTNKESGIKNVVIENDDIVGSTRTDVKRFGYSIFGSYITPINNVKAFARYDYYDPNTESNVYTKFSGGKLTGGADDETNLIIAGLDYSPQKNIHIMPNIIFKSYSQSGMDCDLTGRMTLYYSFSSGKINIQ